MAYEFDPVTIATKAKLMHTEFAAVSDLAAESFAADAWPIVSRTELPEDLLETGLKLYTAHLLYNFSFGGVSQSGNIEQKVGPLDVKQSGGSYQAYSRYEKDPFYLDWIDLVRRYGKGYGIGLAVAPARPMDQPAGWFI